MIDLRGASERQDNKASYVGEDEMKRTKGIEVLAHLEPLIGNGGLIYDVLHKENTSGERL